MRRALKVVRWTLVAWVLGPVVAGMPVVSASDWYWTGEGDTDNWYARHFTGSYDSENRPIFVNNWGLVGIDPPTPGSSDNAIVGGAYTARVGSTNNPGVFGVTIGGPAALYVADGGSLTVYGPAIVNQGEIHIAYGGTAGGGTLALNGATVSGSGPIIFDSAGTLSGALTLDAGTLVRGSGGHISATLTNRGTVNADVTNGWLSLESGVKTNEFVLRASNGGRLEARCTIDQTAVGQIVADDNSTVRYYDGSVVVGGTTGSSGTGKHAVGGGGVTLSLDDITNQGYWLAEDGAVVSLTGLGLANNGTFEVGGYTGGSGWAMLRAAADVAVTGTGTLRLSPGIIDSPGSLTLTNGAGHTIAGYGRIKAAIINDGLVDANVNNGTLYLQDTAKTNRNTIRARNNGIIEVSTAITQTGAGELVADGSTIHVYSGGISGGSTSTANGGRFHTGGGGININLNDITNQGAWLAENGAVVNLVGTTFTNNGTFEVGGYTGGSGWAMLRAAADVAASGTGTLKLSPGIIDSPGGLTLTNGAGHTIAGYGRIKAAVTNEGLVEADVTNGTLCLQDTAKTNHGILRARNNGILEISTTIAQSGAGQVVADGATVGVYAGGISGGSTATANGGRLHTGGGGINVNLNDITNQGTWLAENGAVLNLSGTITNDGTLEIGGYTGGSGWAGARPADGLKLEGSGVLLLRPGYLNSAAPVTFVNAAGHAIRGGYGRIYGGVTLSNLGTLEAYNGQMDVDQNPPQFDGTTLTAGTWKATNGTLAIGGSPAVATNQATVVLSGSAAQFAPINSLATNQGAFSVLGGKTFNTAAALSNAGTIAVGTGSTLAVNGRYTQTAGRTAVDGVMSATGTMSFAGGEVTGNGTIDGNPTLSAGATVSPGSSPGILTFQRLTMAADAGCHLEIGGLTPGTEFDRVRVKGEASLGGTLSLTLIDGYKPEVGDAFVIVTCGSRTGEFAAIDGVTIANDRYFSVTYDSDKATLVVLAKSVADFDADGDVDLGDFAHFRACFNGPNRSPALDNCEDSDFDADSDVDLTDFGAFRSCFNGPNRPPACL